MSTTRDSSVTAAAAAFPDGFEVLDACHRQTLVMLEKLAALVEHLAGGNVDAQAREMATEIVEFFATTARQHHEDEERHVFPAMVASGDPEIVQTVLRLQQDHDWLEEDWMELRPQVDAVACGQSWYDVDVMREGVDIFTALSHDHIALEEACIYPLARARLQPGERREMGREMAARRRIKRGAKPASPAVPNQRA
jgi:hemerythrin-like domain-containing protein